MKTFPRLICVLAVIGLLVSCSKSGSQSVQTPDPATQPEAQAAFFLRTYDRAKSLVEAKDYAKARQTLELFKQYKLTPEQQQAVDKLKAQVPAN